MTPWADPAQEQPRENPAGATAAIFNAVAIGVAGLYAATGSLWLTCAAGGVAASLAGLHLVIDRGRPAGKQADLVSGQPGPAGALPEIEPARAGERGGVPLMDDPESRKRFEDFFREEYLRVVYSIMRLGAGLAEAEDVASDAMYRTLTRWADIADPAAYTHTCARHAYFARARQKAGEAPLEDGALSEEPTPDLLDLLDLKDQERRVHGVLARLPRAQRTVMHLHYAGLSTEDIARELKMQEATVRSNLRHARQRLRTLLSDEDLI
ncbi:sigma-70 family RNA polymerase sigma factor [Streptomyces microflavus]|uniref:RNA polymerase sigma factor n=1 Tax=Streptomyces microflavus TaxID=1919 RepID=UPI00341BF17D